MDKLSSLRLNSLSETITYEYSQGSIDNRNVFLLDPLNQDFLEGRSRRLGVKSGPASMGCLIVFLLPFVVIAIFVVMWTVNSWQRYHALNQAGVDGRGEIISKRISSGDDEDTYYIGYAYAHNATQYRGEGRVDWDDYKTAEIGGQVDIEYVPSNPQISSLTGANHAPIFPLVFALCWNLFVWPLFASVVFNMWRNHLLVKDGQLINGQVITAKTSLEGEDDDFYLNLEYAFTSPMTGRLTTGTAKHPREDLKGKNLPAFGMPLAVLYRNDEHHRPL